MPLSPELSSQAQQWIDKDPDQTTAKKLKGFLKDEDEAALQQAFGERLAFGTAGLRGLLGVGPGNMNVSEERLGTIQSNMLKHLSLPSISAF